MNIFDVKLLRVKECLGVTADKDVAELLGMTKAAFSERKRRDAFPIEKLQELARAKPEVDVFYVITGVRSEGVKQINPEAALAATLSVEPNGDGPLTKKLIESVANFKGAKSSRDQDVSDINKMLNGLGDADFEILKQVIVRFYKGSVS